MTAIAPRRRGRASEPATGQATLPSAAEVLAQAEHENFTVASVILGRRRRSHLMAIYGFARLVDDTGDEVGGDRSALLEQLERQLDDIYAGRGADHPLMRTLAGTIEACELPAEPFRRLIEANRRDQVVTRYETFEALLGYCQLSAAPVGELVLHVFGGATPERIALSDRICAGLQITEHLQDVTEDYERGRIYLPMEDLTRFGCADGDLVAQLATASGRALMAFEVQRARALLSDGAALARTLSPRPRIAVAGFVAGGRAALDELPHGRTGGRGARRRRAFAEGFVRAVAGA
jgi:squalene synthase HpnC